MPGPRSQSWEGNAMRWFFVLLLFSANVFAVQTRIEIIIVTPPEVVLSPGKTQQMHAYGYYSDGSVQDLTGQVTWSSIESTIATVSKTGLVTMKSAGSALIKASYYGLQGVRDRLEQVHPIHQGSAEHRILRENRAHRLHHEGKPQLRFVFWNISGSKRRDRGHPQHGSGHYAGASSRSAEARYGARVDGQSRRHRWWPHGSLRPGAYLLGEWRYAVHDAVVSIGHPELLVLRAKLYVGGCGLQQRVVGIVSGTPGDGVGQRTERAGQSAQFAPNAMGM